MANYGADTIQLKALSRIFSAVSENIRETVTDINRALDRASWTGPGSDEFRINWQTSSRLATDAALSLKARAGALAKHAEEQEIISSSGGHSLLSTAMSLGLAAYGGKLNETPQDLRTNLRTLNLDEVAATLSTRTRTQLNSVARAAELFGEAAMDSKLVNSLSKSENISSIIKDMAISTAEGKVPSPIEFASTTIKVLDALAATGAQEAAAWSSASAGSFAESLRENVLSMQKRLEDNKEIFVKKVHSLDFENEAAKELTRLQLIEQVVQLQATDKSTGAALGQIAGQYLSSDLEGPKTNSYLVDIDSKGEIRNLVFHHQIGEQLANRIETLPASGQRDFIRELIQFDKNGAVRVIDEESGGLRSLVLLNGDQGSVDGSQAYDEMKKILQEKARLSSRFKTWGKKSMD